MGGGLRGYLVEDLAHFRRLIFGPLTDWGTAADGCVLLLNFGRAATRNEGAKVALETAEGYQICICLCEGGSLAQGISDAVGRKGLVWRILRLTNSLLRKSPTSSVVEGPPMFINTIAVGPFEEVAS